MYKQKHVLLISLFLFGSLSGLFSQISVNPSSGCLPAGVTNAIFTYTGSGSPSNIVWNYGDGTPTSTLSTTQHSYPNLGTYTVTFSATIGGSPVTYTALVTVNAPPSGNFSTNVPADHCTPMTVGFTGNSSLSNVAFNWSYGDLSGGSGSSSSHVYNSQGTYTPVLTIQNTLTGCYVNITGAPIQVSSPPNIVITANPGTFTCASSFTTAFDGSQSTPGSPISGGGLTYSWNMGSFGASSQANTGNVVFQPIGVYTIALTVTDNNNCSATAIQSISLLSPTVSAVVPPTVCITGQTPTAPPVFNGTVSSNQPSTTWYMGDGTTVIFPTPIPPFPTPVLVPNVAYSGTLHTYATGGLKTITITAVTGQCIASITRTIMVEEITPQFTATPPSVTCSPTFTIGIVNQSSINTGNPMTYAWDINQWGGAPGGYTSSAVSPTFTASQISNNPYTNYGHPPYYLYAHLTIVSAPLGCIAVVSNPIDTIQRPTAIFELSAAEGCAPLTTSFTSISETKTAGVIVYPITSYTWDFGVSPSSTLAGTTSPPAYTIPPPAFTYTAPGVYYPTLSITTTGGCSHTSYAHTITVVNPAVINYTLPPSPICAGMATTVHLSSPQTVQHWHVETDAGYFSGCVNDPDPVWLFNHPGVHDYTISAYQNSCKSTTVIPAGITVKGPIGKMRFETNCTINKKSVKFYYHLEDAADATLDYGDGSSPVPITGAGNNTVTGDMLHTYPGSGNYVATLTSSNSSNSCPVYTYTMLVTIRELVADFMFTDSIICPGGFLELNAIGSMDVDSSCSRGFAWLVDTFPPRQTSSASYISTENLTGVGMHAASLVVKDINGCKETKTKYFRVSAPAPNFTFNANPICFSGMPVQLINLTPQSLDSVKLYTWGMGDNILYNLPLFFQTYLSGTTYSDSPTFTYPTLNGFQSRTFSVTLTATNVIGCENKTSFMLTVNDPIISVTSNTYTGCVPSHGAITFSFNAASTHTNYMMDWNDGSPVMNTTAFNTNSVYTIVHNYTAAGTYTPTFMVTDFGGCTKSQTFDGVFSNPIIIQTYPAATFTFVNEIDGLEGPGPNFCQLFRPKITSTGVSPYQVNYVWDPYGAGGYPISLSPTITAPYPSGPGNYTISLQVATIPAGCTTYSQTKISLFEPKIDFEFEPDPLKTVYCLGDPITLTVTASNVENYKWDFSDGVVTPSIVPNPNIPSTLKGVYTNTFYPEVTNGDLTIELTGYAGNGSINSRICRDVKRKTVKVIRVLPEFDRNNELLPVDSMHCLGKLELFKNLSTSSINSALNYTWSLGDGSPLDYNTDVSHTYQAPGTYSVKLNVTEPTYSCVASLTKKMVIFPLPTATLSLDTFACPNQPFLVQGSGTPGVSGILSGTLLPGPTALNFNASNSFSLNNTATVSTTYTLNVVDDNGCESAAPSASIYIQQAAPEIHWDTTIVIGQSAPLNAYVGPDFTYTWTPLVSALNCTNCQIFNPVSTTTADITYTVEVADGLKCSVVKNTYKIKVEIRVSLDVPSAFTPNGDGINDMIFPNGWGLRKLNYFKVFNRWGQLVFESNDLNIGWDGVYQGVPQNMETYVYQASADTFSDNQPTLTKTGTFKLLR